MKRSLKLTTLSILGLVLALCVSLSLTGTFTARAAQPEITSFMMYQDAYIRSETPKGLRFETGITTTDKAKLPANAEFGTIVVPSSALGVGDELTFETAGVRSAKAENWLSETPSSFGGGYVGYFGTLVGKDGNNFVDYKPADYTTPYTARGYVKYNDGTGNVIRYTPNTTERALSGVAEQLIEQGNDQAYLQSIVDASEKVQLIFNTNGGNSVATQTVVKGSILTYEDRPADPTKDGSQFAGWYIDSACTQEFEFNGLLTQTTNLYAKWLTWANGTSWERHLPENSWNYLYDYEVSTSTTKTCLVLGQPLTEDNSSRLFLTELSGKTAGDMVELTMTYRFVLGTATGTPQLNWLMVHDSTGSYSNITSDIVTDGEWHTVTFNAMVSTACTSGWGGSGSYAPNVQIAYHCNTDTDTALIISDVTVGEYVPQAPPAGDYTWTGVGSVWERHTTSNDYIEVKTVTTDTGDKTCLVLNQPSNEDISARLFLNALSGKTAGELVGVTVKYKITLGTASGTPALNWLMVHDATNGYSNQTASFVTDGTWQTASFNAMVSTGNNEAWGNTSSNGASPNIQFALHFNTTSGSSMTISEITVGNVIITQPANTTAWSDYGYVWERHTTSNDYIEVKTVTTDTGDKTCLVLNQPSTEDISARLFLNALSGKTAGSTVSVTVKYKITLGTASGTPALNWLMVHDRNNDYANKTSSFITNGTWQTVTFDAMVSTGNNEAWGNKSSSGSPANIQFALHFNTTSGSSITIAEITIA